MQVSALGATIESAISFREEATGGESRTTVKGEAASILKSLWCRQFH